MNEFDRTYVEDPDTVDAAEVSGWWLKIDRATDSRVYTDDDGTLAAVGTLNERSDEVVDLDAFVRPAYQGRGLGSGVPHVAGGGDAAPWQSRSLVRAHSPPTQRPSR